MDRNVTVTPSQKQMDLLQTIDDVLALPLSTFHRLKIIQRHVLTAMGADRCWLMYPCEINAQNYLVPIEETTPNYPGANQLKAYTPLHPVFQHIAEEALQSNEAADYQISKLTNSSLKTFYDNYNIRSQMACLIAGNSANWALGIHHCENTVSYSSEDKQLLTAVAKKISSAVNQLLDIPALLNAADFSSEMLDNSPLAQVIYDDNRIIVYANETYCNVNKRPLADIINQGGKQYLAKKDEHLFHQFFDQIDANGHAVVKGAKIAGDGSTIHVENTGTKILYNGEPHYLLTSKDITEEIKNQASITELLGVQSAIFEASEDGILVEDVNRHVITINQNFYDFFNITPPDTIPIETLELLAAGIPAIKNIDEIAPLVSKLTPTTTERSEDTIYLHNGTVLEMTSFPLVHDEIVKGRVWYFKNITDITRSTNELEESLDIQHAIMEASDDGLLVEDTNRTIITVNNVFLNTFDIKESKESLKKQTTLDALKYGIHTLSNAKEIGAIVSDMSATSKEKVAAIIHLTDGSVLDMTSFPLLRDKEVHGRVWYFKDITEKHTLTEKLSYEATHDPLTKLINRRGFDETLRDIVKQTEYDNTAHALLYLDLDQFKIINDTSGHSAGDAVLIEVSKLINDLLRKADLLARVGGDEFCILLNNCSLSVASNIGEKIRHAIEEYVFHWEEKEYSLGVSIGIISLDSTVSSYEEALNLADTSCYLAKEEGRNRIHVHTTADQAVMQRLQQGNIVSQIYDALRTNRFICYAQKICHVQKINANLQCGSCNYEILVRMLDDKDDIIAPYHFLPAAERYKLMHKIDHWVINYSIQHMAAIQEHIGWLSINLSGQTIANDATYQVIVDAIESSGMAAEKLCFEITETAAISNPQVGIQFLEKLQALGCKIALDDFGTGLSSYEYLKKLPADILKIDGQFIKGMLDNELDFAMVRSINEIGHLMGKETVGEFVENAEILEKLQDMGINYAQGYHLHAPCSMQNLIAEYSAKEEIKTNLNR